MQQGAEARWEEGVRREEEGMKGGMRGGREGWTREDRAVEATVGESLDMDQDMSERGDSRKGLEGSDQRQEKASQRVMVRGIHLEGTEERSPLLELMGESRPQEVMESKDVLGVHQRQVHLHLLRMLLQCHTKSTKQERKLQDWLQKGVSCSEHFCLELLKNALFFLAWYSFIILKSPAMFSCERLA